MNANQILITAGMIEMFQQKNQLFKPFTFNQCSHICNDNEGSFTCACNTGFDLSSGRYCNDKIECNQQNACPQHSNCYNTIGSYGCTCHRIYKTLAN